MWIYFSGSFNFVTDISSTMLILLTVCMSICDHVKRPLGKETIDFNPFPEDGSCEINVGNELWQPMASGSAQKLDGSHEID